LTQENLRLFNKITKSGKSASGKRSRSDFTKTTTDETKTTEKKRTISTTPSGFEEQAKKNGVLDRVNSKPFANLDDRRAKLNRARETASPPESAWQRYVYDVETAPNKATVIHATSKLLKEYDDDVGYGKVLNQAFTAFPNDVGLNNGLSAPQPDMVEGLHQPQFDPFPVKENLGGAAVLIKDDPYSITLPHVAGEWKARGKDMDEARTQSAYDGAALLYGRNQALRYLCDSDPPGHATITTFTTDGSSFKFFGHYSTPSEDGQVVYHQYPIATTAMTDSYEEWKKGRKQLRNVQDHAREEAYSLRDRLEDYWRARSNVPRQAAFEKSLHDIPEEPQPRRAQAQCPQAYPSTELPIPSKPTHDCEGEKTPVPADLSSDDEAGYGIIGKPSFDLTPPHSSAHEEQRKRKRNSSEKSRGPSKENRHSPR
jgi:hypothetical protein